MGSGTVSSLPAMDPEQWLTSYQRRIDGVGAQVARAQRELADLTATASSAHGEVTVTVNPAGALCRLSFGERADEMDRPKLAQAVLDTARHAQAEAARRSREALAPIVGGTAADRVLAWHQAGAGGSP